MIIQPLTENDITRNLMKNLIELQYPFPISNEDMFINSILSPTNIRYDTIEWLFNLMETDIVDKFNNGMYKDRAVLFVNLFQTFGIFSEKCETISGVCSTSESVRCLDTLIYFVKKYLALFKSKKLDSDAEIKNSIKVVTYIQDNKVEIFKDNIRLFIPEIKAIETKKPITLVNPNEITARISETEMLIKKLDKKLDKLNQLKLNYDVVDSEDMGELRQVLVNFEKLIDGFIKDFNLIYSKDLKYIPEDKVSTLHSQVDLFQEKYDHLLSISNSLEEVFALHNRIMSINISTLI